MRSTVGAVGSAAILALVAAGVWSPGPAARPAGAQAPPSCGDGTVDPGEQCDPPGANACGLGSPGGALLPCNPDCSCTGNHFQCYEIRPPGSFERTGLTLVDRFGTSVGVSTRKVKTICAPADKNGEDPTAPTDPGHLVGYDLRTPPFARVRGVQVTDQFGTLLVDVVRPARLLVPSAKSLTEPPPPLAAPPDHFQCYKVRRSRGGPRFAARQVTITTQLEAGSVVTVAKPLRLCTPADKNGESPGAEAHAEHLMCYRTRSTAALPLAQVYVDNQFGPQIYQLGHARRELCVPARLGVVSSTTTTSTSTTTTTSTSLVPGHFTGYLAPGGSSAGAFVTLTDQFGASEHELGTPFVLWVPADKNGEGIPDPVTHEVCYLIGGPSVDLAVSVENQFGTQQLIVRQPFTFCVPSEKEPLAPAPVPLPRNHFKCYDVEGSSIGAFVDVEDQLMSAPGTVVNPTFFCNPVDKNGEGIVDPDDHITCYRLDPFEQIEGNRRIRNQLQEATLDLALRAELCVPSRKTGVGPIPTTTTTTTTPVSTTTTTLVLGFAACCNIPAGPLGNALPVCIDVTVLPPDVNTCLDLGGFPEAFMVCDPQTQACVPETPVTPGDYCCDCPTPVQVCFAGPAGLESQCQPPCAVVPGVACGPLSNTCGGSPSGAFLDAGAVPQLLPYAEPCA